MGKHKFLVSVLLLSSGWPVCTRGEIARPKHQSAVSHETTIPEGETTTLDLFGTPSVGYVFEPEAQALRPILGMPGATILGARVDLGMNVRRAWVSPRQNYVLAEVEGLPELILLDIQRGPQATRPLSTPRGADLVAVSPTGTAIAFYFRNANRLQVTSGLPDSPQESEPVDLAFLGGGLSSLAVSDDGRAVLVASAYPGVGAVYLIHSEQTRVIAPGGDVRAMTFLSNSLNAVIADVAANEVRLLSNVTGVATSRILAEESTGISHPLALQISIDNSRVFVLNSGAQAVTTVDLTTGLLTHLPTNGSTSRLQRLSGDVFQLTDDFRQPMLLLDGATAETRIVFTPKAPDSEQSIGRPAFRDQVPDERRPLPLR
jgi:hypothetical protein